MGNASMDWHFVLVSEIDPACFTYRSDGYINDCNEYDPVADSWTQNLNMAEARKGASVDQLDDGSYWAVGGVTFLPNGKKVLEYMYFMQCNQALYSTCLNSHYHWSLGEPALH